MTWLGPIITAIAGAFVLVLKGLLGTSTPQKRKVIHAKPEVDLVDEDHDEKMLADLGL